MRVPLHRWGTRSARSLSGPTPALGNGWPIGSPLDRWPGLPCTAPVADDSWRTRPVSTLATGSRQLSSSRSSPLMVLSTGEREGFTQSCQRPFYLRQLLPPSDEVRPRTSLPAISETLLGQHPRFAVRYPDTQISVHHLFFIDRVVRPRDYGLLLLLRSREVRNSLASSVSPDL